MKREELEKLILDVFHSTPGNRVAKENAIEESCVGVQMFEAPLVGVASAKDELFEKFHETGVIGPWFRSPKRWLSEAETVVSLFFPFTKEVRDSNRECNGVPSSLWLHGRIEGQSFIAEFMKRLREEITAQGIQACVPALDERFLSVMGGKGLEDYPEADERTYGSNWSERHAAYVCGLGTFGLSKGLITKKGMAGRFGSIILDLPLPADHRDYTGIYDYCTRCGRCIVRCPVDAISFEKGKDHVICEGKLKETKVTYAPRLGCGKCQVSVPCECQIPGKR